MENSDVSQTVMCASNKEFEAMYIFKTCIIQRTFLSKGRKKYTKCTFCPALEKWSNHTKTIMLVSEHRCL